MKLHIDIETYCRYDVTEVGVYKYVEDPTFSIILFAYRWDDGPVNVIDCYYDEYPGESIPADVWEAMTGDNPELEIWAHNANFEYVCIEKYYGIKLHRRNWRCTMIAAAYLGLPLGLANVGKVLALTEQKDARGKALIKFFCQPCNPTKKNGGATINLPHEYPEKWAEFKEYNAQDVRVECDIEKYIARFAPLPSWEYEYWLQDQVINSNGITIDKEFIRAAIRINTETLADVRRELIEITGIENPNSLPQLKSWLNTRLGSPIKSLNKDYLAEAVDNELLPDDVARVLELRQLSSRTSTSKYDTMLTMCCDDGRLRGLIQFYGANRTGRAAGRGVQPHNLKKCALDVKKVIKEAGVRGVIYSPEKIRRLRGDSLEGFTALSNAREAVKLHIADLLYDDVPDVISRLVRTCFVSAPGKSLAVSDFAAIEARVLAWIAGEEWVLQAFKDGHDLYSVTASKMFNVPLSMCGKGTDLRAKGKVAVLALGYQGWTGALIQMGALKDGLQESELPDIAKGYRNANPKIVKLWKRLEDAARHVVKTKGRYTVKGPYCDITYSYEKGYLFCTLPSGRRLAYYGAHLQGNAIRYYGLDQVKKIWVKMEAYGGLLAENITQAIARDCLYDAMYRMRNIGFMDILLHIHDEIVAEADDDRAKEALEEMEKIMSVGAPWAAGLPLKGDGYVSKFYKKD